MNEVQDVDLGKFQGNEFDKMHMSLALEDSVSTSGDVHSYDLEASTG